MTPCIHVHHQVVLLPIGPHGYAFATLPNSGGCLLSGKPCNGDDPKCTNRKEKV